MSASPGDDAARSVLHVLPYVSQDGAFGGPVAVAVTQVRALAEAGMRVRLVAGWDGVANLEIPGVDVELVRVRRVIGRSGFAFLWSPLLRAAIGRAARTVQIAHLHYARDLFSLTAFSAVRRAGAVPILQTHGMVVPSSRLDIRLFHVFGTARQLRHAARILVLTDDELQALQALAVPRSRLALTFNTVEPPSSVPPRSRDEVLFLARLSARKRPVAFVEMAKELVTRGVRARFTIVGPDEGEAVHVQGAIRDAGLDGVVSMEPPVPPGGGQDRIARAAIYVLPSVGEVAPMSVLEALAVGTPTVVTNDCGIAPELEKHGAALVSGTAVPALADSVERLLNDEARRASLAHNGRIYLNEGRSPKALARLLRGIYAEALSSDPAP